MAKRNKDADRVVEEYKRELNSVNLQLKAAYDRFNYADAPELVDASIYEISALKARYDYYLRCIKERTGVPVAQCRPVRTPPAQDAPCAAAASMEGGRICHL